MMDAQARIREWCEKTERHHVERPAGTCVACHGMWPCHAIQDARALLAIAEAGRWIGHDLLGAVAAALDEE